MAETLAIVIPTLPIRLSRKGSKTILVRASATPPSARMEKPLRGKRLMDFPHLLGAHRDLMLTLLSALDDRLASHLLPSSVSVPDDLEYYQNETGSSQGSLCINRGVDDSSIDFVLASWLHLATPTGGAMNITNIQAYMKPITDAPHFQFELVQCSPTFFLFFLDLTPRKDLVLHPDYLKTFYEDNQLEAYRRKFEIQVPEAKPFFSSSLYFRNVISPTGIMVGINCDQQNGKFERLEGIIRDEICPIANEVMGIWMDSCVLNGRNAEEDERAKLENRDRMIKSRAIEMDLSSNMPKQFGQELADRFLGVIRSVFRI